MRTCTNCKRNCGEKSKVRFGKSLCGHCIKNVHQNTVFSAYRRVDQLQEEIRLHKLTWIPYCSLLDTPNREELYWYRQGKREWEDRLSELYTEIDNLLTPLINHNR